MSGGDLAAQWFSQPVFEGMDIDADLLDEANTPAGADSDQSDNEDAIDGAGGLQFGPAPPPKGTKAKTAKAQSGRRASGRDEEAGSSDTDDDEWTENRMTPKRKRTAEEAFEEVRLSFYVAGLPQGL